MVFAFYETKKKYHSFPDICLRFFSIRRTDSWSLSKHCRYILYACSV